MARFKNGYIKLHRSLLEKDINQNDHCLALWIRLLMMANRFDSQLLWQGKQRILPPGSVVIGLKKMAEASNCSVPTIDRWLHYLESTGRIWRESGNRGTLVTICNWMEYQVDDPVQDETKLKRSRNEVNLTGEEENKRINPSTKDWDLEALYLRYPRKIGKSAGLKKISSQINTQADYDDLSRAIDNYSYYVKKHATEEKFIKHFSSFVTHWRDWVSDEPKDQKRMLKPISPDGGL